MRPRSYKHPPQGTNRVGSGPLVTKPEHERAVFANRVLHEIGDEDIWKLREALLDPSYSSKHPAPVVVELTAKLKARYRNGKRRIGLYPLNWKFICQLLSWS